MLRVIKSISQQAAESGVSLSLCGEAAGRPLDAAVLLAFGVSQLSMSASGLLAVKEALTGLDLAGLRSFLETLRRTAATYTNLREPIAGWARDHGMAI